MSLDEIRREFKKMLDEKQNVLFTVPGLLGRTSDRAVAIPTRPGYVYVRIGHEETNGQARNKRVPNRYDLPVILGYDGITEEFQVLAIRQESYLASGHNPVPEVPSHHETHEYPPGVGEGDGSDLVYVAHRQIRGLRVYATGAFTIANEPGHCIINGVPRWIVSQSLNLSSYVPTLASQARFVLVYLNNNGILNLHLGNLVPATTIKISDAPTPLAGTVALAWILLYRGQTAIQDGREEQNIYDLRYVNFSTSVGGHQIISSSHTDAAGIPAAGDVLTFNGTYWIPAPIPPSGGGGGTQEIFIAPRWHVDGTLSAAVEVDGIWRATQDFKISAVWMYVRSLGTTSNTIIDIQRSQDGGNNWDTLFTNPANRPTLAWNASTHVATGVPALIQIQAGHLLRVEIIQAAANSRCLDVQISGIAGSDISTSRLQLNWIE